MFPRHFGSPGAILPLAGSLLWMAGPRSACAKVPTEEGWVAKR